MLVKQGRSEELRELLEDGASVHSHENRIIRRTPLHEAALRGLEGIVRLLLEFGADLHARDWSGETPLHDAANGKHEGVIRFLIEAGADIRACDKHGFTPLHATGVFGGGTAAAFSLIQHGADVGAVTDLQSTVLHFAASSGDREMVELLLHLGADRFATSQQGETPLHWARLNNHQPVIALFESWPAVVTLRTLCIRKVYQAQVAWRDVVPEKLMELPEELEEQKEYRLIDAMIEQVKERKRKRQREQDEEEERRWVRQR